MPKATVLQPSTTMTPEEPTIQKHVTWKQSCRVRPCPKVSPNQKSDVWYNSQDYNHFKKERKAAATLVKRVGIHAVEDTVFVSARGIEYLFDDSLLDEKIMLRQRGCLEVLKAQKKEFRMNGNDAQVYLCKAIPKAYSKHSKVAHYLAHQRGLKDQLTAARQDVADPCSSTDNGEEEEPKTIMQRKYSEPEDDSTVCEGPVFVKKEGDSLTSSSTKSSSSSASIGSEQRNSSSVIILQHYR